MDPFFGPNGRRAIDPEVLDLIERRTGCTPVDGFAEMLDADGALAGSERIASYQATGDHREWLLPLSAGRGMKWQTKEVPQSTSARVAFILSVGFGNGSPLPQPSGQWDIFVNDNLAVSIRVVNHSQLWRRGECCFAFSANRLEAAAPHAALCLSSLVRDESFASFGPAFLCVPTDWLTAGEPAVVRAESRCPVASTRWFQLAPPGNLPLYSDAYRAIDAIADGPHPEVEGGYKVYFGDIHTHSGQVGDDCSDRGCGMGSRIDNYEYARGPGGLDFYALTDHEWQIDPDKTKEYLALADDYNDSGRFPCLPAYEYTNQLYGHRNVYFRAAGGDVLNTNTEWGRPTLDPAICNTPSDLWAAMEATGVPFLTVPHHSSATSHPLPLDYYHPEHDRLFEVYSSWGSSEYYGDFPRGNSDRWRTGDYRDASRRGRVYGLIASSDGHDSHPGNAQSPLVKHHHIFHFLGSGRAAVLAPELTREAVFDALYDRRCYATTGPPIVLDVRLDGAVTGSRVPPRTKGSPALQITCRGTNGIDHIRIVKDTGVVATIPCHGAFEVEHEWADPAYAADATCSYYVRVVQRDRESAWSSPIWVGGE